MPSGCIWLVKMRLWEAEASIVGKPTWRLTTPSPPVLTFWLANLKGSHQKVIKNMQQICQKLKKLYRVTIISRAWLLPDRRSQAFGICFSSWCFQWLAYDFFYKIRLILWDQQFERLGRATATFIKIDNHRFRHYFYDKLNLHFTQKLRKIHVLHIIWH